MYRKRYKRKAPARRSYSYKNTRKIVRSEIKKNDNKDHPLMWTDYNTDFNGDYVKTTPTLVSIGKVLKDYISANAFIKDQFVARVDPTGLGNYREGTIVLTGISYQLRFQQNTSASNPGCNTFRHLLYSYLNTYDEDSEAILNGGDIDQAPKTQYVRSMMWDKMGYLKAAITESTTDNDEFVPGQRIYKGFKKLNHKFEFLLIESSGAWSWKQNDVRFEMASDDNSAVGEIQVYGFMRIYFRVI